MIDAMGLPITNSIVELAQHEPAIRAKTDVRLLRLEAAFAGAIARARQAGEIPENMPLDRAALRAESSSTNMIKKLSGR
jgi:TetR/AcrR family transcriptional regulator, transcriptional repressor for nem operon